MTLIFRNMTIFWDISKWNRGQTKWDGGSIILFKEKNKYILIHEFIINYHASLNRLDASILYKK